MLDKAAREERDKKICELYEQGVPIIEIAKRFCVVSSRVSRIAYQSGLLHRNCCPRRTTTVERDKKIVGLYRQGIATREIAKRLGVARSAVTHTANDAGLHRNQINSVFNEDFFELPLSDEAAYVAGFLMADGWVRPSKHNRTPSIGTSIAIADVELLYKINKAMTSNKKIYISTKGHCQPQATLMFTSKKLVYDLGLLGVVPRKSLIAKVCSVLQYNRHFWRGVIDGDGCFYLHKNKYYNIFIHCGSRALMQQWCEFLSYAGIKNNKVHNQYCSNGIQGIQKHTLYTVSKGASADVARIASVLYNDCTIYLDRKKAFADMAIQAYWGQVS